MCWNFSDNSDDNYMSFDEILEIASKSGVKTDEELGLEPEELVRLKYITGYAKLYEKNEYNRAYVSQKQAVNMANYKKEQKEND